DQWDAPSELGAVDDHQARLSPPARCRVTLGDGGYGHGVAVIELVSMVRHNLKYTSRDDAGLAVRERHGDVGNVGVDRLRSCGCAGPVVSPLDDRKARWGVRDNGRFLVDSNAYLAVFEADRQRVVLAIPQIGGGALRGEPLARGVDDGHERGRVGADHDA